MAYGGPEDGKISVPKLMVEDQWDKYVWNMGTYLRGQGLWCFIDQTCPRPDPLDANNATPAQVQARRQEILLWEKYYAKTASIIQQTVSEDNFGTYLMQAATNRENPDPHELWTLLRDRCSRKTTATKHFLFNELLALKQKPGQGVQDFWQQIQSVYGRLMRLEPQLEDLPNAVLLSGLLPQYHTVRDIWIAKNEAFDGNTLVNHLIDRERDFFRNGTYGGTSGEAYGAIAGPAKDAVNCSFCGEPRHIAENCFRNPKSKRYRPGWVPKDQYLREKKEKKKNRQGGSGAPRGSGPKNRSAEDTGYSESGSSLAAGNISSSGTNVASEIVEQVTKSVSEMIGKFSGSEMKTANWSVYFKPENSELCAQARKNPEKFVVDSGCTQHMTNRREILRDFQPASGDVEMANGVTVPICGYGTVHLSSPAYQRKGVMKMVLYVPDLVGNYYSIPSADMSGNWFVVGGQQIRLLDPQMQTTAVAKLVGKTYLLDAEILRNNSTGQITSPICCAGSNSAAIEALVKEKGELWHRRLGHVSESKLKLIASSDVVTGCNLKKEDILLHPCESCKKGEAPKAKFPKLLQIAETKVGQLVYADLMGPFPVPTMGGKKLYVMVIKDSFSRWTHLDFLAQKSDALEAFKEYNWCVEKQFGKGVSALRTDNGGEFKNRAFEEYCKSAGIDHQFTSPRCPQQNGVAERMNRTLLKMGLSMMHRANLPESLWAEAIGTAAFIVNRIPTKVTGVTPFERWYGRKPDLSPLRIFGCKAFVRLEEIQQKGGKLASKSETGTMVGYHPRSKSYRIYFPHRRTVEIKRHVAFDELSMGMPVEKHEMSVETEKSELPEMFPEFGGRPSAGTQTEADWANRERENHGDEVQEEPGENVQTPRRQREVTPRFSMSPSDFLEENRPKGSGSAIERILRGTPDRGSQSPPVGTPGPLPRRSTRIRNAPNRYGFSDEDRDELSYMVAHFSEFLAVAHGSDPYTLDEALEGKDGQKWEEAADEEMNSLWKMGTWDLVSLPKGRTEIPSKWVLKTKLGSSGEIVRFKARVVAKGFRQKYGIDYNETFAPVVRLESIRALIAGAVQLGLEIHQMDVSTAFLNGDLEEEIYMQQPPGYVQIGPKGEKLVCKLKKSIYGLKQSPRCWNKKLKKYLAGFGFEALKTEQGVYFNREKKIIISIYVDDVIIFGRCLEDIDFVKKLMSEAFSMHDLGELHYILGIRILRNSDGSMKLDQSKYAEAILEKFGFQNAKAMATPAEKVSALKDDGTEFFDKTRYQSAIGSLMYLCLGTRPDLAYAVNAAARFASEPRVGHWKLVSRIFGYLRGTVELGLSYKPFSGPMEIYGFSDSDWASDRNDRKSTTGFVFLLNGCLIAWYSRKQGTVAQSTCEAEYVAMAEATKEALYLKHFFEELQCDVGENVKIFSDNQAAIACAENPVHHAKQKHIDIKYHLIREHVECGDVDLYYVDTQKNTADAMTKGLTKVVLERHKADMGLC